MVLLISLYIVSRGLGVEIGDGSMILKILMYTER
jgi:hypothetical protein